MEIRKHGVCYKPQREREKMIHQMSQWRSYRVILANFVCLKLLYNKINKLFGNKHEIGIKYQKVKKNT